MLVESDHAPPVRQGEGEAEEDVGEAGHQPHDDQGYHWGLVSVLGHILNTRRSDIFNISSQSRNRHLVVVSLVVILVAQLFVLVN